MVPNRYVRALPGSSRLSKKTTTFERLRNRVAEAEEFGRAAPCHENSDTSRLRALSDSRQRPEVEARTERSAAFYRQDTFAEALGAAPVALHHDRGAKVLRRASEKGRIPGDAAGVRTNNHADCAIGVHGEDSFDREEWVRP